MNRLTSLLLTLSAMPWTFAHPGGLDSKGGHNDRKNGGYHYHRGTPSAVAPAPTKTPAALNATAVVQPVSEALHNSALPKEGINIVPAPTAASALAKITIGMTRAQVEAKIGKPNMATDNSWLYSAHGWVRFRGDAVFNIEAK